MPTAPKQKTALQTEREMSEQNRKNSLTSPWRRIGKRPSKRQRRNAEYFEALAKAGDTRRVPRPELD